MLLFGIILGIDEELLVIYDEPRTMMHNEQEVTLQYTVKY